MGLTPEEKETIEDYLKDAAYDGIEITKIHWREKGTFKRNEPRAQIRVDYSHNETGKGGSQYFNPRRILRTIRNKRYDST